MQITEALNVISDGHTIWKAGYAKRVCKALEVPFDGELVEQFYSETHFKGAHMKPGQEGSLGVYSLNLSSHIAEQFGVFEEAAKYFGRGRQAREYARLVREKLQAQGKI